MTDICKNCPNLQNCIDYNISPEECGDINFNDPDFENILSKKRYGEYTWAEMSYMKYTEDGLDYGDLQEEEEEEEELKNC